jgi:hypothetical protein
MRWRLAQKQVGKDLSQECFVALGGFHELREQTRREWQKSRQSAQTEMLSLSDLAGKPNCSMNGVTG